MIIVIAIAGIIAIPVIANRFYYGWPPRIDSSSLS